MKQNQIKELNSLSPENYENIFNVYKDEKGMYFYNLLETVVYPYNLPANAHTTYTTTYGDTWPYISYKALNNPNLWWLILLANNIHDPTIQPTPGITILIPVQQIVKEVISQIGKG